MKHHNSNCSGNDPVCGLISGDLTAVSYRYNGRFFYFCSESCRDKFIKNPRRYLGRRRHRKLPPRMRLPINGMKGFHSCYR
jgi:YHS domain-containing protein